MDRTTIFTIGFTKKSAEDFFSTLCRSGVRRLIDVRLNNVSQLAGFAKRDDLRYFLKVICDIEYLHRPDFAPTKDILDTFKQGTIDWDAYQQRFLALIERRNLEKLISRQELDRACLLCSEATPAHCHRRLVAEHLQQRLGNIEIRHL